MSEQLHVLVVDNNLDVSSLVKEYLCDAGCRVSIALSGCEMSRVMERSAVDVVLLDLIFPNDDGLVLARSLRAEHPNLGIIIMTGADKDIDQIVEEIGADDGLTKPFHLHELLARIESATRRADDLAKI